MNKVQIAKKPNNQEVKEYKELDKILNKLWAPGLDKAEAAKYATHMRDDLVSRYPKAAQELEAFCAQDPKLAYKFVIAAADDVTDATDIKPKMKKLVSSRTFNAFQKLLIEYFCMP